MPQTFIIDQAKTFEGVAFLKSVPKLSFGTETQERTSAGIPKWHVSVVAGFSSFGRSEHEVIKVSIAAATDPGADLVPYTPIRFTSFAVGVVPPEVRKDNRGQERVVGGTTWYAAEGIEPVAAVAPAAARRASGE